MAIYSSDYDGPVDPETGLPLSQKPLDGWRKAARDGQFRNYVINQLRTAGSALYDARPKDAYGWATLPAKATWAAAKSVGSEVSDLADRMYDAVGSGDTQAMGNAGFDTALAMTGAGLGASAIAGPTGDVIFGAGVKGRKGKKAVGGVFDGVTSYTEAMKKALRGDHIKRAPNGKYIGAPESIDSPGALAANRQRVLQKVEEGAFNADWYDRARATGDEVSGGDPIMGGMFARGGAANSPQNTPMNEVNDFIRQHNGQVLTGDMPRVRTNAQRNTVARAYSSSPDSPYDIINPEDVKLGRKTGPYADAKDPSIPPENLFLTANDLWHGRVMGYKNKDGSLFNRAFTPQEHGFLAGENLILADRAQRDMAGAGYLPENYKWTPRSAQAATWGQERLESYLSKYEKAKADALRKGKKAPPAPDIEALKEKASYGIDDAVERNTGNDTYEFVTGQNTGHLGGLNAMDEATRAAYTDKMAENYLRTSNGRMRDPIYEDLQMYQRDALPTRGAYLNSDGVLEHNPGWTSRPVVGVEGSRLPNGKRGGPQLEEPGKEAMRMAATLRGLVTGQEATGWTKFTGANSASKANEVTGLRFTGSPAKSEATAAALKSQGLDTVDLGDGVVAGKFDGTADKSLIKKVLRGSGLPADSVIAGRWESGLEEIPWTKEQGTGATTRAVLEALRTPGTGGGIKRLTERLDSGRFRQTLKGMNEIDKALAAEKSLPVRKDLMKLRDMIAEKGLDGVIDYVKKTGGAGLPALVAVPTLSSLLEEPSSPVQ